MAPPGPRHGSRASQADEEPLQTTNVGVDPRPCPATSLYNQPEKRNNHRLERPCIQWRASHRMGGRAPRRAG